MHHRPGVGEQGRARAADLQFLEAAELGPFDGDGVPRQGDGDFGLEDLVAPSVGGAEHQRRHAVEIVDHRNRAESHPRGRPRDPGEHKAGGQRHIDKPDEGFDGDDQVGGKAAREHVAVADGAERLDAEEEGVPEVVGSQVIHPARGHQVERSEHQVDGHIGRGHQHQHAPERQSHDPMVEVDDRPSLQTGDHRQALARAAHHAREGPVRRLGMRARHALIHSGSAIRHHLSQDAPFARTRAFR